MLKPILKYPGSKRWMIGSILDEMLAGRHITTFVDAFCGSAVIPLNIEADNIIINDYDIWVMNIYRMIKNRPRETWNILRSYIEEYNRRESSEEKSELYYAIRKDFNNDVANFRLGLVSAARFIFLNKTCFNGMCRFNKRGEYNVPWGKKKSIELPDVKEDMAYVDELCRKFNRMTLKCCDFEDCCDWDSLDENCLVFLDSPYFETFDNYTGNGFDLSAHERVAKLFERLSDKGVMVIATNSTADWIYERYKEFNIRTVDVRHNVNRVGNKRNSKETIITANI